MPQFGSSRALAVTAGLAVRASDGDPLRRLEGALEVGLQMAVLLFSFSLAIAVVLVFAVRVLLVLQGLPVPSDPVDMAKPRPFRALVLGGTLLLAPLVALRFLPMVGSTTASTLAVAYGFQLIMVGVAWFVLDRFYKGREDRAGRGR